MMKHEYLSLRLIWSHHSKVKWTNGQIKQTTHTGEVSIDYQSRLVPSTNLQDPNSLSFPSMPLSSTHFLRFQWVSLGPSRYGTRPVLVMSCFHDERSNSCDAQAGPMSVFSKTILMRKPRWASDLFDWGGIILQKSSLFQPSSLVKYFSDRC